MNNPIDLLSKEAVKTGADDHLEFYAQKDVDQMDEMAKDYAETEMDYARNYALRENRLEKYRFSADPDLSQEIEEIKNKMDATENEYEKDELYSELMEKTEEIDKKVFAKLKQNSKEKLRDDLPYSLAIRLIEKIQEEREKKKAVEASKNQAIA